MEPHPDNRSVIFIGDTIPPDPNGDTFLMRTYLAGYQNSCDNGNNIVYYVDNMDVEVNPYYLFAYDCSDIDSSGGIYEFYNTLLHELGHCHMLQHNVEEDELMYPYVPDVDAPSFNDVAGGLCCMARLTGHGYGRDFKNQATLTDIGIPSRLNLLMQAHLMRTSVF